MRHPMRFLPTFISIFCSRLNNKPILRFNPINCLSNSRFYSSAMSKTALVVAGNGSEDIEFVGTYDVLHRGGVNVTSASVSGDKLVTLSHGTKVQLDHLIEEVHNKEFDAVVVPGGLEGCNACAKSKHLVDLLKRQKASGKIYAAICAAPELVLAANGVLDANTPAVGYPGCDKNIPNKGSGRVLVSGNCVTSISPGSALEFGLKLVELLCGVEKAERVKKGLVVHPSLDS